MDSNFLDFQLNLLTTATMLKLHVQTTVFLLSVMTVASVNASSVSSDSFTVDVFIGQWEMQSVAVKVPVDSSCADLYDIIGNSDMKGILFLDDLVIPPDPDRDVVDFGVIQDSVVYLEREPMCWSMYRFAAQFENPDAIGWWHQAEYCWKNPYSEYCSDTAICQWDLAGIICEDNSSIAVLHLESNPLVSSQLSGHLTFDDLPESVHSLYIVYHSITSVDFSALKNKKALTYLCLASNRIGAINFQQLTGSNVETLDLDGMTESIQMIDFQGIERTSLKIVTLFRGKEQWQRFRENAKMINFRSELLNKSNLSHTSRIHIMQLVRLAFKQRSRLFERPSSSTRRTPKRTPDPKSHFCFEN